MIDPVEASTARRALLAKGFEEAKNRDHFYAFLYIDGKKTAFWVKISHGARQIRRDEIKINAQSVGIKGEDLYLILCCTHDAEKTKDLYLKALSNR